MAKHTAFMRPLPADVATAYNAILDALVASGYAMCAITSDLAASYIAAHPNNDSGFVVNIYHPMFNNGGDDEWVLTYGDNFEDHTYDWMPADTAPADVADKVLSLLLPQDGITNAVRAKDDKRIA